MGALKTQSTPELKGLYAGSNRFTQPKGTIPRISNLYMIRRGAFHTIAGSKWLSSYDGLAPHSAAQLPIVDLEWYSPSAGGSPAMYMAAAGFTTLGAAPNFILALQITNGPAGVELENASVPQFQPMANQPCVPAIVNGCQIGDYLVVAFSNQQPPDIFPTVTELTVAMGTTDAVALVMDTTPFPTAGFILIDSEIIQYTGIIPTSFTGLTRGALGTTAAIHAIDAQVFIVSNAVVTQLAGSFRGLSPTATTIFVASTAQFPSSGYLLIGQELIQYSGKTATTFTGATRGANGTTAAWHPQGSLVYSSGLGGQGQVWAPITNNFDPSLVYSPWPGTKDTNTSTPANSVSVNIGTLIYVFDATGTAWLFRAQNSGVTGWGPTYAGPQFFPTGLIGIDGTMTLSSTTLTTTQGLLTAALVGQPIVVQGAGAGGGPLTSIVASFTDDNDIVLADAAQTAVSAADFTIGIGYYGETAKDTNPATTGDGKGSGTVVWVNVGQAALSPPGAAFVFQHLDNLYLWGVGINYGEDGITGPDALWESNPGAPTIFDPSHTTFVGKGDGTTAQGGAVYSLSEAGIAATPQLVLFKDASTYSFLNSFPNESLVEVSGGLGCIAPKTIQFIGGYGIMRLSYAGVTLFDGQLEHVTEYTDAIRGYLFGGLPDVVPVDFSKIQNCVSTQGVNPPMYVFVAPLVGSDGAVTRGFGYDFGLKQWFIEDYPFPISAAAFLPKAIVALNAGYQSLIGGAVDGAMRRVFFGDPDWDGVPIKISMQLPDWGFPGTPVYVRRVNVRITADGGGAAPKLTAVTFQGVRRSSKYFQRPLNVPSSILGSMDVGEIVLSGSVTIAGQGQMLIEGSDAQTSDKPTGRIGM